VVTTTTDTTEPYIFVSYASADRERVLPVVAALQVVGVAVWFDQADIGGGTNYGLEIAEGIERCAAFVLLCSAASLASRNVKQEIQLAWKFERPYLPLLLEPVEIPKDVAYWLEGHCFDLADTLPYGPWIDLFLHVPQSAALPPLPEAFAVRGTVGAVPSQMALFAQVEDFLRALATRQPVAILLDDLHWSDPASLDLLRFLARSVAGLPILILVTYRSDELTRRHPLYALLPQLAREAGAARIDLSRLDDDAICGLVGARYGLPDADASRLTAYLRGRAEGNALFVSELLRALEEGGVLARDGDGWRLDDLAQTAVPTLLRQVIEGRAARLNDDAQEALGAAAVIGQEVPFAVWATVGGTDEETLTGIVERAATARLMEETADGTGARFLHALIREAMYEGLLPSRRRRLHRAAGEALAALPTPDADAVAHHFRVVGDVLTAFTTAVERMREAVALAASLCVQVAWILRYVDKQQAFRYAEEAVKRAAEPDDPVLLGVARCSLGNNCCLAGDFARGVAELRAAVAALEALPPAAWERTATPRAKSPRWWATARPSPMSAPRSPSRSPTWARAGRPSPCWAARWTSTTPRSRWRTGSNCSPSTMSPTLLADPMRRSGSTKRLDMFTERERTGTRSLTMRSFSSSVRCCPITPTTSPFARRWRVRRRRGGRERRRCTSSRPSRCAPSGSRWTASRGIGMRPRRTPPGRTFERCSRAHAKGDTRHHRAVAGKAGGSVAACARAVTGRREDGTGHEAFFG